MESQPSTVDRQPPDLALFRTLRWRAREADGRHPEPHLQLIAVEGLSADLEGDPRPTPTRSLADGVIE